MNFPSLFIHGDETTDSITAAPRANRFLVYLPFLDPQGGKGLGTNLHCTALVGTGWGVGADGVARVDPGTIFFYTVLCTHTSFSSVSSSFDGELEKRLEISSSSRLLS